MRRLAKPENWRRRLRDLRGQTERPAFDAALHRFHNWVRERHAALEHQSDLGR
ncbi:hypothetical protein NKH98_06305 [Mesorhizobium sp. M0833]|uniref:hypothetical protein n=1 Tax=Mesorhizobium sp. M0833 TaxID=2957009 RepID=UPI003338B232